MITFQNGEYGAASQQLSTAHSLAAANDAQSILAQALYNLGNCALADEDYTSAAALRRCDGDLPGNPPTPRRG